ncbi:recombinase family protein [Aurantibacillus circumpalustris]|uniref:recombinase family protein n=1 Tax=Aurantibacillus circumpalustris TaxID=3036359 RepID=UPI00295C0553|nr:recombinase family protein [Aurantibacillus circumpalustris]
MKTAIYVRCSTKHHHQDTDNQLLQLNAFCAKQGFEITKVYSDYESGDSENRKSFKAMFADASKRRFDLLLFWSLDRFSREGVRQTITHLQTLESYGVVYKSYSEQYIDSTGIFKDVIISILATLARQEKIRISERVKAGLEKAKLNGKTGGRPKLSEDLINKVAYYKRLGFSNRRISRELKISNTTVGHYV